MADSVRAMIAEAKEQLREEFREMLANRIEWGPITISSSSGEDDKVKGYPGDGEDDQDYEHEVKRMQHFGFRSRPPKDTWAVFLGVGGGATNKASVAEDSDKYGPSDLEDGESAIYNKVSGVLIKLTKDGDIVISAAAGKTAQLNGNTYSLPQWEGYLVALKAFITALKAAGSFPNIVAAATAFETALSAGSDFKSTKAKNG